MMLIVFVFGLVAGAVLFVVGVVHADDALSLAGFFILMVAIVFGIALALDALRAEGVIP